MSAPAPRSTPSVVGRAATVDATKATRVPGPLLLVADGSGLVPLMAMLRHRAAKSNTVDARLLISTGSPPKSSIAATSCAVAGDGLAVHHTFTRDPPAAWRRFARRLDADMLGPAPMTQRARAGAVRTP